MKTNPSCANAWRPLACALAAAWPVAAVLLLAGCGGGGSEPAPREQRAGLQSGGNGVLVERVRGLLRERFAARSLNGMALLDTSLGGGMVFAATATTTGTSVVATAATTVQEAGVDEADHLKPRGEFVYAQDTHTLASTLTNTHQLRVARVGAGGTLTELQALPLPRTDTYPAPRGLLVADTAPRLLALSNHLVPVGMPQPCPPGMACIAGTSIYAPTAMQAHVQVQAAEMASDGRLSLGTRLDVDGTLVASRRIGDVAYLVLSYTPRLAAEQLAATATPAQIAAALAALSGADILPSVRINGGEPQPLLGESDCHVQPTASSLSITVTTVLAVNLASPGLERTARCFLGGTEAMYMAPGSLYLATTRSPQATVAADGSVSFSAEHKTDIHKFAVSGMSLAYRASGEVAGHLGWDASRMALRMSEHNGDLRVLSFTGSSGWGLLADAATKPASPATLSVLRENTATGELLAVATLPNARRPAALGKPGEQVHGVRFAGDRGYVVTFRQVDPLYVLDLSDPQDPKAPGVLEVPGFSDHLLPLPGGLLFGVGRDADPVSGLSRGIKVALFDVRDAASPRLLRSQVFGAQGSSTALDSSPHGLNLAMAGAVARLALPMTVPDAPFSSTGTHGLHRFEVDTAARTMLEKPRLDAPAGSTLYDVWSARSLQFGDALVYYTQGHWLGSLW